MNTPDIRQTTLPVTPTGLTTTGLNLPDGLNKDDWLSVGEWIRQAERSVMWWIGDWLNYGERNYGDIKAAAERLGYDDQTVRGAIWVCKHIEMLRRHNGLSFSHHREVAALEPDEQDYWLAQAIEHGWTRNELRAAIRAAREPGRLPPPKGQYSCIVIDPPWRMEKIERDVRPKQHGFDYPPMDEDELAALTLPAADDCHLYLWTTHKHLPMAHRLAEAWGFKYECLMTWVKNVGFTPFSWMRSTEHVLFCRKGSLPLLKMGLRLDFNAKVREHSRKPDEFYKLIKQASPSPRIDMFSRGPHAGFDQWGNEAEKFSGVA